MLVEITIKATIDPTVFGCETVKQLEDILLDAEDITLSANSVIDGNIEGFMQVSSVTED